MTITRQGTRAFTRKCQAQVQKEDAPITGPRGVSFPSDSLDYANHGFMNLRSSFSRELAFIIPRDFHGGSWVDALVATMYAMTANVL